jgi:hypothetical protein
MKVNPSASLTASGAVGLKHSVYYGYTVTVVTATGPINIRKDTVSGQIIDVIPAATAAGASKDRSLGVAMDGSIFVEFNGGATGTVVIFYE